MSGCSRSQEGQQTSQSRKVQYWEQQRYCAELSSSQASGRGPELMRVRDQRPWKFEGLSLVAECLFSLVNGDDMFTTFAQLKDTNTLVWVFSRAYLYSFISLFIYMVLSLFIALITDAYETIKKYQKDGFPLTDLQKFLREQREFTVPEENDQQLIDVRHQCSVLCCCKRVPENDSVILMS